MASPSHYTLTVDLKFFTLKIFAGSQTMPYQNRYIQQQMNPPPLGQTL